MIATMAGPPPSTTEDIRKMGHLIKIKVTEVVDGDSYCGIMIPLCGIVIVVLPVLVAGVLDLSADM